MFRGFPLHADLYVGRKLLTIFEDVAVDDTGMSLLLTADDFFNAMKDIASMPESVRELAKHLLAGMHSEDRFEEFYSLLYGSGDGFERNPNPWSDELRVAMDALCSRISLSGARYLLNDRLWLHGRTAPSGGVSMRRMHRLAFS